MRTPPPLAAAALTFALASAAAANPHGILWARGKAPLRAQASGNLLYYGGPVIEHPRVYAVFWGPKVDAETRDKIGPFFENMLDSAYMDWLSEYDTVGIAAVDGRPGTNQRLGRGTYGGAFTIQPANTGTDLTDAMIQAELEAQIAAGKLPKADASTLYMTYFPAGISVSIEKERSCESFCAYHEGFTAKSGTPVYYGVMPVCGGFGCGFGNKLDALTSVSSHEALEAITDPFPTPGDKPAYPQAWNAADGQEIADLCAGGSSKLTGHGVTSVVQDEWDNKTGACKTGPWTGKAAEPTATARLLGLRFKPSWTATAAALAR